MYILESVTLRRKKYPIIMPLIVKKYCFISDYYQKINLLFLLVLCTLYQYFSTFTRVILNSFILFAVREKPMCQF